MHNTLTGCTSSKISNLYRAALLLIGVAFCFVPDVFADTLIWNGGGATANWSDSGNWFGVVPANGDTLVFQGGQPKPNNTNNIVGLTLNQIRFIGASGGYVLNGNSFGLSNSVSSIEATNSAGINQINNDITVPLPNLVVNVATTTKLILRGGLSGPGGLVKNGGGTNLLNGPVSNTYLGTTTINAGLMEIQKVFTPAATAIPGNTIIGNGVTSATLRNLDTLEIADTANITINDGGTWDLNSHDEIVGPNLTISGILVTGIGTATLSPNPNITIPPGANATINGNFDISSGTCTIQNDGSLNQYGVMSGSATIIKNGTGAILFDGANTFTGSLTANGSSYIWVATPLGLGTTNGGTTLNDNTFLAISGNITVTNEALTMNTPSTLGIDGFSTDTNTWAGPIVFNTNIFIAVVANGGVILAGPLSGPGGFTKTGTGTLTLACPDSSSSYTGDSTLNTGILLLNSINVIRFGTLTVGDGLGGALSDVCRYLRIGCIFGGAGGSKVIVKSSGLLDLNGFSDDVGPLEMDGGRVTTGAGFFTLFPPFVTYRTDGTNGTCLFTGNLLLREDSTFGITNDLTIQAVIGSGNSYTLTKNGPRNLYLNGANTYTGLTIIQQGWLHAETSTALGNTNFGTVVSNNASLVLDNGSFGITNEALVLNGPGAAVDWGALDVETFGTNIWAGPITINGGSTFTAFGSGSFLRIIGPVDGPGTFTTIPAGVGGIYLEGAINNSYAGMTFVLGGSLFLAHPNSDGAVPHDLIIGDEFKAPDSVVVRYFNHNQVPNSANVTVHSSGFLDLNTFVEGLGTVSGSGHISVGTLLLDMYGTSTYTFDGLMSGAGRFRQEASGTAILTGTNTYTGTTDVDGSGAIYVNGFQPQSHVHVNSSSGSFGGSGVVGEILCAGHLRPGNSPGILTCSNLTLTAGATFHEEISGRFPGTTYDQMNVRGTNNLANALLALSLPLANGVSVGDQIVMINNDGVDAITGTFAGYPPGSSFSGNGFTFVISYTGGTGNDAIFTVTNVPGDVVSSSVTAGNGDHIVSPNECNNLSIVVTNETGTPMTGITATLSTTTLGVEVTQPYSSYANIPANGKGTNIAPYQISTLPALFACGQDINLQLTVHPVSHGAFTIPFVVKSGTPSLVPLRFDISTPTNVPDVGTIESTNVVSGVTQPISRVAVSLWMNAPIDSDMSISLIAPNGTLVDLSSGNGGGPNFGLACSPDLSRTTFDDTAANPITAGSPPYTGTFRPEGLLSSVLSSPINGNWRLRVNDGFVAGSPDTLRCWSLLLYPIVCASGSGTCDLCSPPITGTITTNDSVQIGRLTRNGNVASCNVLKPFPGLNDSVVRHCDVYTFTNTTGADACVTVELLANCNAQAIAYLNSFDPTNIANNYIGDAGSSSAGSSVAFSCNIPAGAKFIIAVNEVDANTGCNSYSLTLSGFPCPPPALSVEDVPGPNAHLFWPNSAGGYLLESSPLVEPTTWSIVTNEPIILNGNYNVTNTASAPSRFYRLHKP
jgi:autotransporter-associated beta strand protein